MRMMPVMMRVIPNRPIRSIFSEKMKTPIRHVAAMPTPDQVAYDIARGKFFKASQRKKKERQ